MPPYVSISAWVSGDGRQCSASRCTHSETASTSGAAPLPASSLTMSVRRSAHMRPMPLQNVVSGKRSPKRGKRLTRMRVRRTTHTAACVEPGVLDVGVGHVLKPAGQRVEADATRGRAVGKARPARLAERAHVGMARLEPHVITAAHVVHRWCA